MSSKCLQQVLRQKAENRLKISHTDTANLSSKAIQKLMHEFQVYQIELELQNEELRDTQLELSASRNQYQNLYDCAPICFLTLNKQGEITKANQMACKLLAQSNIKLLGAKYAKYIVLDDQDRFYLFFQQLLKSPQTKPIEIRIKLANQPAISVLCQGSCHHLNGDHQESQLLLILQDISHQKRVEQKINQLNAQLEQKISIKNAELLSKNQKLQETIKGICQSKEDLLEREAKLNSIFNAAIEGIITIDEKGIIQSVNNAVINITGYPKHELIGHDVNKLMPYSYKEQHAHYLQHYLSTQQAKVIGTIRQLEGQHKDGTIIPIDVSISEYKIGHKTYFTGMIRDVSERKRKELLDKQHLDELAHVMRLGLMGEMASGIAHEVNQPLTAIATYSQLCLQLLNSDQPDLIKLQETLQKTEQQALRAGQIIRRMREFISTNGVHRSSTNINELVQEAMNLANDDCQQFSIQHTLDLAKSIPYISADAVQIEQVVLNLIKNGIDALTKLPPKTLRQLSIQTYLLESEYIEVRIKDNGLGITKAEQAKIFTPFFTTKETGMGMGLSICQSLINSHGGELRFKSELGKGSTFYFTLPIIGQNNATK